MSNLFVGAVVKEHVTVVTMHCPKCGQQFKMTDDFIPSKIASPEIEYWKKRATDIEQYYYNLWYGLGAKPS